MPQKNSPYLSCTQVLSVLGLGRYSHSSVPSGVLERAGTRGSILHGSFAHHLETGRTLCHTIEALQPYQEAFERACVELGIGKPLYAEYEMRSDRLELDGILDYFGPVRAASRLGDEPTLSFVDWKTGDPRGRHPDGTKYDVHPSVGLQVAGYQALLADGMHTRTRTPSGNELGQVVNAPRYALYLLNDGTYRFIPLDDPSDRATMLAAVRVANLARRLARTERPA